MVKTTNIDKHGKKRRGKSLITGDCIFPFKYKGKLHNVCIDGKDGKWCATSLKPGKMYVESWAFCLDEEEKIPEKQKKKSSKKINFDDIQILDQVDALEEESGKVKRGTVEKKNSNRTLDIRFFDGYKFQPGTELKYIRKVIKYTGDKNEQLTEENFDLILAKITFIVDRKPYNSLTIGHSKKNNINGSWLVLNIDGDTNYFKKMEDALDYYISEREYWSKRYDIINFEGFDDDLIRDKIPELSFEPVDLSTCKYDRSMLDEEQYLKDIPKNKVIKVNSENCYNIDELVQYLISSNGNNRDPLDIIEGLTTPIWTNEEELLFLRNFPTIPEDKKEEFQKIMDEQIAILRMPPYIDIIMTDKGKEFLNRLLITGKVCTEDYTEDFTPAQTEITRTREYLQENFTKEEIEKLKKISTRNGLNIEGVLLNETGASCIHGVGFRFSSLYFTAFIKIRETMKLLNKPFELELFPGVAEVRPDEFIFCHGADLSSWKDGIKWPLTALMFSNDSSAMYRGQDAGGVGRILRIRSKSNIFVSSPWGFTDQFAEKQIKVFKQHYDTLTSNRPQNILMQFADRPMKQKIKGKLSQVEDCKKTKKNSGRQINKKTYKKQGRISSYLKQKIRNDLNIYERHNLYKIKKVLPKGEIIKSNGNIMKIEPKNLHFFLYNGYFVTKLLTTLEEYKSEPDNPGMENGIDIDWKKVQIYPEQNNLNYDINRIHHRGISEHTLTKSQYKNLYLKKMYLPVKEINGEDEGFFELTLIENQLKKYNSEIYYMLKYSGITSSLNHGIFASFVNDFKKSVQNVSWLKELSALNKSGNIRELIFDYVLKGYVDENYGDLEELENRYELEKLKGDSDSIGKADSDSIDKAILDALLPQEGDSSSSKKSRKSTGSESSSSDKEVLLGKQSPLNVKGIITDEQIADMKARGKLPYDGDISKAMQKQDRNAVQILIRSRNIEAKLLSDVKELSPVAIQDEIIKTPSPKKKNTPKAREEKKSNEIDSDSFGKKIEEAIDDGKVAIRKKKSKKKNIFAEIDSFAYQKDSDDLPSPIHPNDSPMEIDELYVPLRLEDLEVSGEEKENSSSSGKFFVFVKNLMGGKYNIELNSQNTLKEFYDKVSSKSQTPNEQMKFIYKGKKLPQIEDPDVTRKISDFNFKNASTINMVLRLGPPWGPFEYKKSDWFSEEEEKSSSGKVVEDISDEKIADMKARNKLPFNGDLSKAIEVEDKAALKILIRSRNIEPKLLSDSKGDPNTPPVKKTAKKKSSSSKDKTFNIYVKTLDGKTITIKTKSNNTVKDIMEQIQKDANIAPQMVRFVYESKRLPQIEDDDVNRKLSEFNIESESTFHLIYRLGPPVGPFKYNKSDWFFEKKEKKTAKKKSSSSKDKAFNIYIKILDGRTITIKTKSDQTVEDIMDKLFPELRIKAEQIILIYEQRRLPKIEEEDVNRKLSDFNIKGECTLHLVYRLGPPGPPFKYRKSEWFHEKDEDIQIKKTQKKSSSSSKKKRQKKDTENIVKKYYDYDDKGLLINQDILGRTIVLYRSKDSMTWSIQVIQVRNRYKITITYDTKTKGSTKKVYWWNPKNTDSKASPDKLLQNMFDQGYKYHHTRY